MSLNGNAETLTFGAYLDLANDVKPWLQIPATDTTRDNALTLITGMACNWVQKFLGGPVAATSFTRRFDGWSDWSGAYIMLPYQPVLEVVQVIEFRGTLGAFVLPESVPTAQTDGWQLVPSTGRLNRVFPGNVQKPWFPGSRNIEISWVAGYQPVPPDIQVATLEMVAHWFRNTQQQPALRAAAGGPRGEYDPVDPAGMFAGVPDRIVDLLEPYMRVGIG